MSPKNKKIILFVCVGLLVFLLSPYRYLLSRYGWYLIILACPLLHVFMMRGHGHGQAGLEHKNDESGCQQTGAAIEGEALDDKINNQSRANNQDNSGGCH